MNQRAIGDFIAQKRRSQNFTQERLGEMLGVSNKAISKWENGKSMPDYSIIQDPCSAFHMTLPELIGGKDAPGNNTPTCDDERILDLIRRTQELERQKNVLFGLILIVLGIACGALSNTTGGTNVLDFISGVLLGLSVAEILIGIWIAENPYNRKRLHCRYPKERKHAWQTNLHPSLFGPSHQSALSLTRPHRYCLRTKFPTLPIKPSAMWHSSPTRDSL